MVLYLEDFKAYTAVKPVLLHCTSILSYIRLKLVADEASALMRLARHAHSKLT
jgi:hypothetical protein